MTVKIKGVPKIKWTKEGKNTIVATGLINIVATTETEEIIDKIPIRSELNTKNIMPDETAAFFKKDLKKKIQEALNTHRINAAVQAEYDKDLGDTVQTYLNNNVALEGEKAR